MADRGADGFVLVVALLVLVLTSALVTALVSVTASETLIAANFRQSQEALHAADAGAERALGDLAAATDWDQVLGGAVQSTFADGAPFGTRGTPGGAQVDLTEVENVANCRKPTACSGAEMDLSTVERPWGPNNPRWQLYAYGRLEDVVPGVVIDSPYYVIVLVADDPSETDGNPLLDALPEKPGTGVLVLRAEAFGPRATHKIVELTISRTSHGSVRVVSWRELR
jgi:PilX N-terminal